MGQFFIDLSEYKDGKFIGLAEIGTDKEDLNDSRVYLSDLYVTKSYRHKGEGTKLMNRVIDTCKKLSITRVYLWCKPEVRSFYKKFGAEEVNEYFDGYELMMIDIK